MSDLLGVAITGVSGRMGQMLIESVHASETATLVGALERPDHPWVGQDLGRVMQKSETGLIVQDKAENVFAHADVVIDFTSPTATVAFAKQAAQTGTAHVIGTTGLSDEDLAAVAKAAEKTVIVRAGNMSLGVNLLVQLTKKVAAALDEDFDIEVIEAHHNKKVDAPSGTALMLGEAAAEGRGIDLAQMRDSGRDGITGARQTGHIGFAAIRGGDIVGEHDVLFAGVGERITLRHVATDRLLFAKGALKAAQWAQNKPVGEYNMLDVLGL